MIYMFQLHECDTSDHFCLVRASNPEQAHKLACQAYSRHHEDDVEFIETSEHQEGVDAVLWDSWHKQDVGDTY